MGDTTISERRERADRYLFHGIHPHARFGTASDRYAGWIGQIYSESHRDGIKSRRRKMGGRTFEEQRVPVASVAEYFEHFDVLEIDYTFWLNMAFLAVTAGFLAWKVRARGLSLSTGQGVTETVLFWLAMLACLWLFIGLVVGG